MFSANAMDREFQSLLRRCGDSGFSAGYGYGRNGYAEMDGERKMSAEKYAYGNAEKHARGEAGNVKCA